MINISSEKKPLLMSSFSNFLSNFVLTSFLRSLNPIRFYLKNHSFKVPKNVLSVAV
ncbi:22698_t:CDS:2 [Rhizophagus irregularis]|nr:22698_t:CDS:2 [Rhizophagus irregularis]